MKPTTLLMFCLLILSGCGFGQGRQDAVAHFDANHDAIEEFAAFFRSHSGIDYVEFRENGSVDLTIADKERFDRKTPPAIFKFDLFGVPIESHEVTNALEYASVPKDIFMRLKVHAAQACCISIEKPFWENYPVEVDIGYARQGMSKLIFRKFKDGVNVTNLISLPPWRDDCLAPLTGNWVLVIGKGAFN